MDNSQDIKCLQGLCSNHCRQKATLEARKATTKLLRTASELHQELDGIVGSIKAAHGIGNCFKVVGSTLGLASLFGNPIPGMFAVSIGGVVIGYVGSKREKQQLDELRLKLEELSRKLQSGWADLKEHTSKIEWVLAQVMIQALTHEYNTQQSEVVQQDSEWQTCAWLLKISSSAAKLVASRIPTTVIRIGNTLGKASAAGAIVNAADKAAKYGGKIIVIIPKVKPLLQNTGRVLAVVGVPLDISLTIYSCTTKPQLLTITMEEIVRVDKFGKYIHDMIELLHHLKIMADRMHELEFRDFQYNIIVCGRRGCGKSSLVNAMRQVAEDDEAGYAFVDDKDATQRIGRYDYTCQVENQRLQVHIEERKAVLWDTPGYDIPERPLNLDASSKEAPQSFDTDEFLFDNLLTEANVVLIAFKDAISVNDLKLINALRDKYMKLVVVLRTNMDYVVENFLHRKKIRKFDSRVAQYLKELKDDAKKQIGRDDVPVFLISSPTIEGFKDIEGLEDKEFVSFLQAGSAAFQETAEV